MLCAFEKALHILLILRKCLKKHSCGAFVYRGILIDKSFPITYLSTSISVLREQRYKALAILQTVEASIQVNITILGSLRAYNQTLTVILKWHFFVVCPLFLV